jgi:hypothetical protein
VSVLKVREVRDDGPDRTLFRIAEEGRPPCREKVARLVTVAAALLAEYGLPGAFRTSGDGDVVLEVASVSRHFLHDGVLFAALDVVNDPVRNPTLTLYVADGWKD